MDKIIFMFFPFAFFVIFTGTEETTPIQDFCVGTLNQTTQTLTNCIAYAAGAEIDGSIDRAILAYFCCLGLVDHEVTVTHSYKKHMNETLVFAISQITSAADMPDVADFMVMCKHLGVAPNLLEDVDYSYWLANGKTVDKCLSV